VFDYVRNEFNPHPVLVTQVEPAAPGRSVRHLPFSVAPFLALPADLDALHARHGRKYWSTLGRKQRRLCDSFPDARIRVRTTTAEIAEVAPAVRELYAERWRDEYTGLDWKTPEGFAPYAAAARELAEQDRALVATLEAGGRLLAFAYCLCEPPCCHLYQFAATRDARFRAFSPGTLLLQALVEELTQDPRFGYLDLMLGDAAYKREWATGTRTVWLRLEDGAGRAARARLSVRAALERAKLYVRFGNPRLRRAAKWALLQRTRWRDGRRAVAARSRRFTGRRGPHGR
jgi:hypothetical protein